MTDTRRRRYASKLNEMTAPQNNERSSYKISVSIADLNDENKWRNRKEEPRNQLGSHPKVTVWEDYVD